jgi:diketogulonate reductase-like aldo/keto reductase
MQYRTLAVSALVSLAQAQSPFDFKSAPLVNSVVTPKGPLLEIPLLGFGTWNLTAGQNGTDAVKNAITIGYRHIDGATAYGNQVAVGKGIEAALAANPALKREDLWVTTKLWSTRHGDQISGGTDLNLQQLNLTYVDLSLMVCKIRSQKESTNIN